MSKIITTNSSIKCTLGTCPSKIKATTQTISKIKGELVCTEHDKEGSVNILTFGNCKRSWYRPTCKPSPIKWDGVADSNKIDGFAKLLNSSTCKCSFGGTISFIDTGANSFVDAE